MDNIKPTTKFDRQMILELVERTKRLLRFSWKLIVIPSAIIVLIFLFIYSFRHSLPFSPQKLTQDPLSTSKLPFYFGIISNLGIMLWSSAAAINFLGAGLLRKESRKSLFFLVSGIFVLWLCLDDLLMFHELVFPDYLGISENIVYIGYLLIIVAYLLYFFMDIYSYTDYTLLVAALACFAASILVDKFWGFAFGEDGAKFLGILLWAIYYFRSVTLALSERMVSTPAPETGINR